MVNNLPTAEADIKAHDLSEGRLSLLDRITNESHGVLEAEIAVFDGQKSDGIQ
jgi:hypothetical protein